MRRRLVMVFCLLALLILAAAQPALSAPPAARSSRPPTRAQPVISDEEPLNLVAADNGGSVVSASDEVSPYEAEHLIDGFKLDYDEWWSSPEPEYPIVIVFAFADEDLKVIDHVALNPWLSEFRSSWVKDFEIFISSSSPDFERMRRVGSYTLEDTGVDQRFDFAPVEARYIALVITSNYGGSEGVSLNEFEVYEAPPGSEAEADNTADPNDLAAYSNGGKIVAFSSEDSTGDWSPNHLIDGRNDTYAGWSSEQNPDDQQYVVFGFRGDNEYVIDHVVLNPYSHRYHKDWIKDFELRASSESSDPEEMESLGEFTLAQEGEDQEFRIEPTRMRYLALLPLSNYGGTAYALNELEAFGAETAGSTIKEIVPAGEGKVPPVRLPTPLPTPTAEPPLIIPSPQEMSPGGTVVDNIAVDTRYNSLVPVIYHLYGGYFDDLISTTITNYNRFPVKIRVEVESPNYTETDMKVLTLDAGEKYELGQSPPLLPDAMDMLNSQRNASLHLLVEYLKEGEKRLIYEDSAPLTIYSRGDFPWNIPGFYNGTLFLATMVTPNDPALDELMRLAADRAPGGIMTNGYGDEEDSDFSVRDRMRAIYDTIAEQYRVIYVAAGVDFVPKDIEEQGFTLQRLKLPYEVLHTNSGMCVELSLLFASAFEKLQLRPIIVTKPGHVFVGVPISWNSSTYVFVETTLIGRFSFDQAVESGNQTFNEILPELEKDTLDKYYWLDVSKARDEGILPIPWR